jgi:hypothetical protein
VSSAIVEERLRRQYLTRPGRPGAADVVAWFGAVQAQEYAFARWALALRMREGTTDGAIERAFDEGRILRTHVLRPTWHFVTPSDIRWMLELTAPHVHRTMGYYERQLELDTRTLTRGTTIIERALGEGPYLTRADLAVRLARAGLALKGQRLAHVVMYAELEGVICSGPRSGKQFTYALLAERAPAARRLLRDEALAELTRRFFTGHGPATIRDFVWWSGLRSADARRGLEIIRARSEVVDGLTYWMAGRAARAAARRAGVHLLPVYDEYLVAYRDRDAVPHGPSIVRARWGGPVMFLHAVIIGGQVAGTWRTARGRDGTVVDVVPLRSLRPGERRAVSEAAGRYGRFLEVPVSVSIA